MVVAASLVAVALTVLSGRMDSSPSTSSSSGGSFLVTATAVTVALIALGGTLYTTWKQHGLAADQVEAERKLEDLRAEYAHDSDRFRDELERARSFAAASRQQALDRINAICSATAKAHSLGRLTQFDDWVESTGVVVAHQDMAEALACIHVNAQVLEASGVFSPEAGRRLEFAWASTEHSWNVLVGVLRSRAQEPGSALNAWTEANDGLAELERSLSAALAEAAVPE